MLGTVRTLSPGDETKVIKRINEIATLTAQAAGATAVVECPYGIHYPVTFNNVELTNRMLPSLIKTAGQDHVKLMPAVTASEDFSFFSEKVPGLFFSLGGMPKGQDPAKAGPHHTSQFIIDDSGLKVGVNALCNLVFDYSNEKK
jgi:metal-dependent amidase/aminoacylase/carboxypeptidase family protein